MKHSSQKHDKNSLICGRHPVMDGINEGVQFEKIWLSQSVKGEFEIQLRKICKKKEIPLSVIPKDKLQRISSANNQGVIGLISKISYQQIEDILPHVFEQGQTPFIVALDGVTDVRNIGAIARTALGTGAHALLVPMKKTAQINNEAIKSSAGALLKLPVCRTSSLVNTIDFLRQSGMQVVAADLSGSTYPSQLDLSLPTLVIMGSEDEGIRPHIMRKADKVFQIPIAEEMESFNVSVAAGMVMYECFKQRMNS